MNKTIEPRRTVPTRADRILAGLATPEDQTAYIARHILRLQTEREPTAEELGVFVASGDLPTALADPRTFELLASNSRRAGRQAIAQIWTTVADVLAYHREGEDDVSGVVLETTLKVLALEEARTPKAPR